MIIQMQHINNFLFFMYLNIFDFEKNFLMQKLISSSKEIDEILFDLIKKLYEFFRMLKNLIIDVIMNLTQGLIKFYFYFQQTILPLIKQGFRIPSSENGDKMFFVFFVFFLIVFFIIILDYFYHEVLTNKQAKFLLDKYINFKKPYVMLFVLFKKGFNNIIYYFDDIIVANILWWGNIFVALLVWYSNWFKTDLLLINWKVHMFLIFCSGLGLLCYDPEK